MSKTRLLLPGLLALILVACQPTLPPCESRELVPPAILSSPANRSIIDTLRPSLSWQANLECSPQGYSFELASPSGTLQDITQDPSWSPSEDLTPATGYTWRVAAVAEDGTVGPYTNPSSFFTGPICQSNQSLGLQLDSPAAGTLVSSASPALEWSYTQQVCTPEDHSFAVRNELTGVTVLSGQMNGPGTGFSTPINYLEDCQLYRWWVVPTLNGQPADSYAYTTAGFVTNFTNSCPGGACDAASLTAPVPLTPPDGSLWTKPSPEISWQYDLPDCLTSLRFVAEIGPDPAFTPGSSANTELAGTSSLRFDPAAYLLEDCTPYYWRVSVLLPDGTAGPVSPIWQFTTDLAGECTDRSSASIRQDAVCREGPGTIYPISLYLSAGESVDLLARSEDSSWVMLRRPDGYGSCWLNATLIDGSPDLENLPDQPAPPPPLILQETPVVESGEDEPDTCVKPPHPDLQNNCWWWDEAACQWICIN